jgi:hypothetical protein
VQDTVMKLGYLGLILIVYEGECMSTKQACVSVVLTSMQRWSFHESQSPPSESLPLKSGRSHWRRCPNRPLLHTSFPSRCHPAASIRGWSCALLDFIGHNLHHPHDQRIDREPARRDLDQCGHD